MNYPARISLGHFPTPIEKLARLSRHLGGPELWVKRDDQSGLATGGNKVRKLEFLLADAHAQQCDHIVTLGGPQSNHVRTVARTEGLLLDPVYTGRAVGGLLDLIRRGAFRADERVLFWHTGGTAALSAFAEKL